MRPKNPEGQNKMAILAQRISRKMSGQAPQSSKCAEPSQSAGRDQRTNPLVKLWANPALNILKKIVKLGAENIKKQILSAKLLPALSLESISTEIKENGRRQNNLFVKANEQLTTSMLFFHRTVQQNVEEGELLRLQVQKCYRRVPRQYFQSQLVADVLADLLTYQERQATDLADELSDHRDEIEYNLNLQVNYKMRVFMTFVTFLESIGNLADLSLSKIEGARAKNEVIREIVVQGSIKVNELRHRKEKLTLLVEVSESLRKMRKLEGSLMSQIHAKNRIGSSKAYEDYCHIHKLLKGYCCKRSVCKFWDLAYYLERAYQESFSQSLRIYLCDIVELPQAKLANILRPKKTSFLTFNSKTLETLQLDESYEVDENIELVIKSNIQRQIVNIFEQGMHKCTYPTDELCKELSKSLETVEHLIYATIDEHNKLYEDKKDSLTTNNRLTDSAKGDLVCSLLPQKYIQIIEVYALKMQKILTREFSVINKALQQLETLRVSSPDKHEITSTYLLQILVVTLQFIDDSIGKMISKRTIRQSQMTTVRKMSEVCQQLQRFLSEAQQKYVSVWAQLALHYGCVYESSEDMQIKLEDKEHNSKLQSAKAILGALLRNITQMKTKLVDTLITNHHKVIVSKQLRARLEEDCWQAISVKPLLERSIRYLMFGANYIKNLDKDQKNILSSSLLLEKNPSFVVIDGIHCTNTNKHAGITTPGITATAGIATTTIGAGINSAESLQSNPRHPQYELHISQSTVGINGSQYKVTVSTESIIGMLVQYLQLADAFVAGQPLSEPQWETFSAKLIEFVCMYTTHIKSLIINSEALKCGKIKSKTITGRHLLLCFSQLKLIKHIMEAMFAQGHCFGEEKWQVDKIVQQRLSKTLCDLCKKFTMILEVNVKQAVSRIEVNPRKKIECPTVGTSEIINALSKSYDFLRDNIINQDQFPQFLSFPCCKPYLQRIVEQHAVVYKYLMKSTGSRKMEDIEWGDNINWKFKELEYFTQNLLQMRKLLPAFELIEQELELQRRKILNY